MPDFSKEWITDEKLPRTLYIKKRSAIEAGLLITTDCLYVNEITGDVQYHFARTSKVICKAKPVN